MTLNLSEIGQTLKRLVSNIAEQNRRWWDVFFDPTPKEVDIPQYDEEGNLVTVKIKNLAKIKEELQVEFDTEKIINIIDAQTSKTPAPNKIPISDDEGFLNAWIKQGINSGLDADLVRGLPADFTSNLTGSGFQKLPSGLIIQWGIWQGTTPSDLSPVNVTFPITFPHKVFSVSLTPDNNNDDNRIEGIENIVVIHSKSNSKFSFMKKRVSGTGDGSEIYTVNWIAIGY